MKLLSHYIEEQMKMRSDFANWTNHIIGDDLLYSYRDTVYDRRTYPSDLHYHDYYELVILEEGNIQYICDGSIYHPRCGDIILIPPGKFHMSAINCEKTHYKRHVFYLYPSAFDSIGHSALVSFLAYECARTFERNFYQSTFAARRCVETFVHHSYFLFAESKRLSIEKRDFIFA